MGGHSLQDALIAYSEEKYIDAIGFCSAEPFLQLEQPLRDREEKGYMCSLETKDYMKKIYPSLTLKGAKSFIVILESYDQEEGKPDNPLSGHISMAAVGSDYHKIVMDKLDDLKAYMHELVPCQTMAFVDMSPFSDRAIAQRAGLGYIGKNSMLINEQYGSKVFIGYLLTDYELDDNEHHIDIDCGTCQRCMKACPTGAIIGDGNIDCKKCLSYITQHKGPIKTALKHKMGKQIYGCDVCQLVCPYNQVNNKEHQAIVPSYPLFQDLLHISNKDFKTSYGQTASGWRGKKLLQRNSIIGLGNSRDKGALNLLATSMNDLRDDIRSEVVDAIRRLAYSQGLEILLKMRHTEKNCEIIKEIDEAISELGTRKK